MMHVERTTDPAVLRWVRHDVELADLPSGALEPPPGTDLGELLRSGALRTVARDGGDLLVVVADPAGWPALAPVVNAAVAALQGADRRWLAAPPIGPLPCPTAPARASGGGPGVGCGGCSSAGCGASHRPAPANATACAGADGTDQQDIVVELRRRPWWGRRRGCH